MGFLGDLFHYLRICESLGKITMWEFVIFVCTFFQAA